MQTHKSPFVALGDKRGFGFGANWIYKGLGSISNCYGLSNTVSSE